MSLKDEALQGMDIEEFIREDEKVAYALFYPKRDVDKAVAEIKKRGRENFKKYLKKKVDLSKCEYFLLLSESDFKEVLGK